MRYFAAHEHIYARRLAHGYAGWDDGAYDDHALRDAMFVWSSRSNALKPGARILELGCGTGALSCQLASAGYVVTGLDISSSAIAFAQTAASDRGLTVEFVAADASSWLSNSEQFDVIIDSHMLHCIALPRDRQVILGGIRGSLKKGGELWTESMLLPDSPFDGTARRMDESGVLWVRNPDAVESPDAVSVDGELWLPSRYLASSADSLIKEYGVAGLTSVEHEVVAPASAADPPDFRARFHVAE